MTLCVSVHVAEYIKVKHVGDFHSEYAGIAEYSIGHFLWNEGVKESLMTQNQEI